jgi:hypothetical protein
MPAFSAGISFKKSIILKYENQEQNDNDDGADRKINALCGGFFL